MTDKTISKLLSLALRHKPEVLQLTLDPEGWASTEEVLRALAKYHVDLPKLQQIVASNDKKRYAFSADGSKIRANQGHSVAIDLALPPMVPPPILYHGTATQNRDSILQQGLLKGTRQHVHLSSNMDTAQKVGQRHGKPLIFIVDTEQMAADGLLFYCSDNGAWLTDFVPPRYIRLSHPDVPPAQ